MVKDKDKLKNDAIKDIVSKIESKIGTGSFMTLDGQGCEGSIKEWISTGSTLIDKIVRGIPVGKLTVINGQEYAGKSTLSSHIMSECQKIGGYAVLFDTEHSFNLARAIKIGIRPSELLFSQPSCFEEVWGRIEVAVTSIREKDKEHPIVIVWDSISSTPLRSEIEADPGENVSTMGQHSRIMSFQLRKLLDFIDKNRVALVFINQLKSKIGVMYGSNETYLAENAQKYSASVMIRMGRKGKRDDGDGILSSVSVTKHKWHPPFGKVVVDITGNGIDETEVLLDKAVELNKVALRGKGRYQIGEKHFRRIEWPSILSELPELKTLLIEEISKAEN